MSEITIEQKLEELERKIDSFAKEHAEFRSVHVSRRGVVGPAGPKGDSIQGPKGDPGKDADISEVIQAAKREMQADLQTAEASLLKIIAQQLEASGVTKDGVAVLLPGPVGPKGDSVVGPKGDSIVGPAGKNGLDGKPGRDTKIVIGHVTSGDKGGVSVRVENGAHVLDFVLPRGEKGADSQIPGPRGEQGPSGDSIEGPQGIPGEGVSKSEVVEIVLDMKRRKAI